MIYRVIHSPLLDRYLLLLADKRGIRLLIRRSEAEVLSDLSGLGECREGTLFRVVRDLKTYLGGRNVDFRKYMVNMESLTPFERMVMEKVREIPFGEVRSYQELASSIGRERAYRAVGRALGKNPAPIIIPCHRVVAKDGIGGYAFGVDMKKKLLALEKGVDRWG